MTKFHINPTTGNANKCSATKQCPFGDLDADHYATKDEAARAYESKMAASLFSAPNVFGPPILTPPTKMRLEDPKTKATYDVDYDYDDYGCNGCDEDICRCSSYSGLHVTAWGTDEGVYGYARSRLGLPLSEKLPQDLIDDLRPYENFETIADDFEIWGDSDYYGEVAVVEPSPTLNRIISDFYYNQPNAVDKEGLLPYLRSQGFDTTGKRPLQALREALKQEHRSLPANISAVKGYRVMKVKEKFITKESKREAAGKKDPTPATPVPVTGQGKAIAGVLLRKSATDYVLLDGYRRAADFEANGDVRSKDYVVLTTAAAPGPYDYRSDPVLWKFAFNN